MHTVRIQLGVLPSYRKRTLKPFVLWNRNYSLFFAPTNQEWGQSSHMIDSPPSSGSSPKNALDLIVSRLDFLCRSCVIMRKSCSLSRLGCFLVNICDSARDPFISIT